MPPPSTDPAAEPDTDEEQPEPIPPATEQDRLEVRKPQPPTTLSAAKPLTLDFNLNGDSKQLFEDVAQTFG